MKRTITALAATSALGVWQGKSFVRDGTWTTPPAAPYPGGVKLSLVAGPADGATIGAYVCGSWDGTGC